MSKCTHKYLAGMSCVAEPMPVLHALHCRSMATRNSALLNGRYKPAKVAELVERATKFWAKYGDEDIVRDTVHKAWGGQAAVLLGGAVGGAVALTSPAGVVTLLLLLLLLLPAPSRTARLQLPCLRF